MTKQLPHLRRESGHWLCTESRKERNILRGTLGDTPCQAFYYFMQKMHAEEIRKSWNSNYAPSWVPNPFFCA